MKRSTTCRRAVPVVVLAGLMAFSAPLAMVPAAYAETQSSSELNSELAAAQQKLAELSRNLEIAAAKADDTQAQLEETSSQIDSLQSQIAENEQKAEAAQASLKETVRSGYKDGNATLLDIVFSSKDFSDLTSRIFYASRTAEKNNEKITEVNDLIKTLDSQRDELSQKKSELDSLYQQQTETANALAASQSEAESYVNGLSSELQAALAAEREAQAAQQKAAAE
ncbi:PcsB-like coiled-coil domain-containing protein, partial [Collinsella vaginalis]|uniref:PcsB-like coiled-coil domain-containing protein n=1 Tax=Collinsella vaginalis TaxID=1870987 RepID=UPI001C4F0B2E